MSGVIPITGGIPATKPPFDIFMYSDSATDRSTLAIRAAGVRMTPLPPTAPIGRSLSTILIAEAKYPPTMLGSCLHQVTLCGSVFINDNEVGGTFGEDALFLVGCITNNPAEVLDLEHAFHHELSSILLRRYSIDTRAWQACNPPGFEYLGTGVDAIRAGKSSLKMSDAETESGFVNQYAKAALEEDINETAANMFCGGEQFWKAVDSSARLMAKTELLADFYGKIDRSFTIGYFRGLADNESAVR
jgi:hypothetical protein